MCGFVAAFASTQTSFDDAAIAAASARMTSRGPDGHGTWREEGAVLAHRRLAILDLDPRAAQPMHSPCGRYVIAFNGEIYNFRELRRNLEAEGVAFQTTSDTEVLLALFAKSGEAMLPSLHGMFAFVIWDRVAKRAFVARDPYGIKPLYYAQTAGGVILASQVKALVASGLISQEPDLHAQAAFWMLGSVPEPRTWYRKIRGLAAGHCMWIEHGRPMEPRLWHDIGRAWHVAERPHLDATEVRERVRGALRESVARHLVADVPIGVFLSGGIDSGAVAALMLEAGAVSLQGVTITYDEFRGMSYDEAPKAARMAAHYGLRHHVRRVTRQEFLDDLPRILRAMDQPSIDGINTWYASKAVAELGLKVVVSGVGGDELFQGYSTFHDLPRLVKLRGALKYLPGIGRLARSAGGWRARHTGNRRWNHAYAWSRSMAGAWWLRRSIHSPEDLVDLMGADAANEVLRDFDPEHCVKAMTGPLPRDRRLAIGQIESTTYLRNQLLRDSDWASMDHSVELRTPLVDAHLLRQVTPLLPEFSRFPGKALLADAPSHRLPYEIVRLPKTGFGIPVGRWLAASSPGGRDVGSPGWARQLVRRYESDAP